MPMLSHAHFLRRCRRAFALMFATCALAATLCAQSGVVDADDDAVDPVRLFNQGQEEHARQHFARALELYDAALKLRPAFPEADYQKGLALVSLNRLSEAEQPLRRAAAGHTDWPLPQTALGLLFVRLKRDQEAEPFLRRAIALKTEDAGALVALASLRLRASDKAESLRLIQQATNDPRADTRTWAIRAGIERANGDMTAADKSVARALALAPDDVAALIERAELRAAGGDNERAVADLEAALKHAPDDTQLQARLVQLRAARVIANGSPTEERAALEKILPTDPRNAAVLARLGALTRTLEPQQSLDYYRRAAEIEPRNADYATGYAAALVQARRFADAVVILRRVIAAASDHYAAHANLATALDELKQFAEALNEYQWINRARPDLSVTYFFMARAHDLLGDFPAALADYETFLARADPQQNQLEIEKVNLRLPSLRNQIKRGLTGKRK